MSDDDFTTIDEAADMLDVSRRTIHRYIASGDLGARKIGRRTAVSGGDLARIRADRERWSLAVRSSMR